MHDTMPIWRPSRSRIEATAMYAFARAAERSVQRVFADYDALWRWSIAEPERFWNLVWDFCAVRGERGERTLVGRDRMPGAAWFPDAKLNLAENLLRDDFDDNSDALVFWGENRVKRRLSRGELRRQVAVVAAALRAQGIGPGDCIAAFMPNMPETLVAMLAATSLGAIFTSTSPDFGIQGVLDRFGQTRPKVLFAVDGYWYNGKPIDCLEKIAAIAAQLPDLQRVVLVPYLDSGADTSRIAHAEWFAGFVAPHAAEGVIEYVRLPFDHPVYVLYSSGTTGVPKGIVHGAGGTLLQHLKEQRLHCDVRAGDRYFYFTTCGWTMWNVLVSALASGATLLLYDGSPFVADGRILFDFAQTERMTHFGTSAKFIDAIAKTGLEPGREFDLGSVRVILSTGSPLVPESYDYVYRASSPTCNCHRCPAGPISARPSSSAARTCRVARRDPVSRTWAWQSTFSTSTELRWSKPRASSSARSRFPACRSGSGTTRTAVATARVLRAFPGHLVSRRLQRNHASRRHRDLRPVRCRAQSGRRAHRHRGDLPAGRKASRRHRGAGRRPGLAGRCPRSCCSCAFATASPSMTRMQRSIRDVIRANATPRHVPAKIVAVTDIPRTKERQDRRAGRTRSHPRPPRQNIEALANPEALEQFRNRPELDEA
jgi:acyl-coenzyme A synthetase/AMP-(fatty) acid ligase